MKMKYKLVLLLFLFFLWYITLPSGTTEVVIYTLFLVILIWELLKNPKKNPYPYIIGNSKEIEYLTQDELEERLKKSK